MEWLPMRYVFGEWTLDTQRAELCRAGRISRLRRKAFQVLAYLLAHSDRVVSKQELCEQVWPQQFLSDAALESTIKAVRQAIGDSGRRQQLIKTVYGSGYRLIVPVAAQPEPSPEAKVVAPPRDFPARPLLPARGGEDSPLAPVVCAAPPDEPLTQGTIPASLLRVSDAERRQLTVMFCALTAELPLARPLDPDDLYAVI